MQQSKPSSADISRAIDEIYRWVTGLSPAALLQVELLIRRQRQETRRKVTYEAAALIEELGGYVYRHALDMWMDHGVLPAEFRRRQAPSDHEVDPSRSKVDALAAALVKELGGRVSWTD